MVAEDGLHTFFVVQGFSRVGERVCMDEPLTARTQAAAMRIAKRLAERKASVMVLARTGNLATGEFEEPVLLKSYGELVAESDLPF